MSPQQRAALEHAFADLRRWYEPQPKRAVYYELRRASTQLQAALREFDNETSLSTQRLLALLQAVKLRPQADIFQDLQRTAELLRQIEAATDARAPRGPEPDHEVRAWVLLAADAWVTFTGQLPTTGTGWIESFGRHVADSEFLTALRLFAKEQDVPIVTRDALRDLLPAWEERHRGGQ